MFAGVSGLLSNAEGINVIGNNIANVNTIGFKTGRMLFSDLLSANIGNGSQIGRGVQIQKVDNIFGQGSFESTENVTDVAIQGNSFFAVKDPNITAPVNQNSALLTRAGAFRLDSGLTLVNADGYQVLDTAGNPIKFSDNATAIAALNTALTAQASIPAAAINALAGPQVPAANTFVNAVLAAAAVAYTNQAATLTQIAPGSVPVTAATTLQSSALTKAPADAFIAASALAVITTGVGGNGATAGEAAAAANIILLATNANATAALAAANPTPTTIGNAQTSYQTFRNTLGANITTLTTSGTTLAGALGSVQSLGNAFNTIYSALPTSLAYTNATDAATAVLADATAANAAATTAAGSPTAANIAAAQAAYTAMNSTIGAKTTALTTGAPAAFTTFNATYAALPSTGSALAFYNAATQAAATTPASASAAEVAAAAAILTAANTARTAAATATASPTSTNISAAQAAFTALNTTTNNSTFTSTAMVSAFNTFKASLTTVNTANNTNAPAGEITAALAIQTAANAAQTAATNAVTNPNAATLASAQNAFNALTTLTNNSSFSPIAFVTPYTAFQSSQNAANTAVNAAMTTAAPAIASATTQLATATGLAFSKIVSVDPSGLITYLGKDGITTNYYNASGSVGVAANSANAATVQRLAVMSVANQGGLEKVGGTMFRPTTASGVTSAAFTLTNNSANGSSEKIFTNSLEQSNVDMAAQFVKMILTQRAYSANSKTITTADEMTQEVLNLKR
jgi:flagellar hook protein FlgE